MSSQVGRRDERRPRRLRRWGLAVLAALAASALGSGGQSQYRSLTLRPPRVVGAEYFGIHLHRLRLSPGEQAIQTSWPPVRFGMLRLWDSRTRWADVEPEKGVWRFERLDQYVKEAESRGVQVLYTLGSTPGWASARPNERCGYGRGCAAEPRALEDWRDYVRTVARRYRGVICCYELWNEPDFSGPPRDPGQNGGFYSGDVSTMVAMARIAREVLREEDPSAMLLSPGIVNGAHNRLDKFLAAGGGQYVQGIAYHFYAWNDEARMLREIDSVRAVMRKHDVAKLPLWSTEAGVEVYEPGQSMPEGITRRLTRQEGAAMMVRQIVLGAFAGLDKYIYYAWDNDKSGMVDRRGRRQPAWDAMRRVQEWLVGVKLYGCEFGDGGVTTCWGEKKGALFAIVWQRSEANAVEVSIPDGLTVASAQSAVEAWDSGGECRVSEQSMCARANPSVYSFRDAGGKKAVERRWKARLQQ